MTSTASPVSIVAGRHIETLLRYLYNDLSRISEIASEDIVLHRADRDLSASVQPVRGKSAVQEHEDGLIAATGGTLKMEVQSITANTSFGAVLGRLHAGPLTSSQGVNAADQDSASTQTSVPAVTIPFCGVWRFVDGKAVEHWENASDPEVLTNWLIEAAGFIKNHNS